MNTKQRFGDAPPPHLVVRLASVHHFMPPALVVLALYSGSTILHVLVDPQVHTSSNSGVKKL